jgi:hypothetical protein
MRSDEDILRTAYEAFDVTVRQAVRDAKTGEIQSDTQVVHRWRLQDGLVVRMDVLETGMA